jgi:acetyl esterase/lipase
MRIWPKLLLLLLIMKMLLTRIVSVVVLVAAMSVSIFAQSAPDTSMVYVHNKPVSCKARFLKFGMVVIGLNKGAERKYKRNKFNQTPARIPSALKRRYAMVVEEHNGRKIWTFTPRKNASGKVILYLHGGSYVANILSFHWDLIAQLLAKTNATIVVPDYPLAPAAQCPDVYAFMMHVYSQLLTRAKASDITIMGDSAGGGLSLGLAQEIKAQNLPQPGNIVLLAPWLDVSMTNPGIVAVEKQDKMLNLKALQITGKAYAGNLSLTNPRVSPIYGNFEGLGKISVFIGTHDVLIADCRKLKAMLDKQNTSFNYFEYPGMFHVWMAVTGLKESKATVAQIAELVK